MDDDFTTYEPDGFVEAVEQKATTSSTGRGDSEELSTVVLERREEENTVDGFLDDTVRKPAEASSLEEQMSKLLSENLMLKKKLQSKESELAALQTEQADQDTRITNLEEQMHNFYVPHFPPHCPPHRHPPPHHRHPPPRHRHPPPHHRRHHRRHRHPPPHPFPPPPPSFHHPRFPPPPF